MPGPTELVLIRHGRPKIERDRPPSAWELEDDASDDIRLLAAALPRPPLIVTSDEVKTKQTAQIIQEVVGGDLRVDGRLREVSRPTEWVDDYEERAVRYLTRGHEPGWEPADDVAARVTEAMNKLPSGAFTVGHGLALTLYTDTRASFDRVTFWRGLRLPDAWRTDGGTPPPRLAPRGRF